MSKPNHEKPVHLEDPEEDVSEHLPEWVQIFGELKEEAEEAYPDGRLRVIIPRRRKARVGRKHLL